MSALAERQRRAIRLLANRNRKARERTRTGLLVARFGALLDRMERPK